MKSSNSACGPGTSVLGILIAAGFLCSLGASAQTTLPDAKKDAPTPTAQDAKKAKELTPAQAEEAQRREAWRAMMRQTPMPKKGCFKGVYPKTEWQEVPCTTAPNRPYPPRHGRRPQTVGNGVDFAAEVTGNMISATGSFDSVTGVTSETGTTFGPNCTSPTAGVANVFSLQLNTKPFTTSVCSTSPNPGCLGWQQFVYSNDGVAFIQYWLLQFNTTCPAGFTTFQFPSSTDTYCFKNGANAVSVPVQTIGDLADLSLTGTSTSGGNDAVVMSTAGGDLPASNADSELSLAAGWTGGEFIVVGDACGSEAVFNNGSTLVVRTTVHNGTRNAPTCVLEGFTGETNNLTLVGTPAVGMGAAPGVVSTQSNVPGTMASCAGASGIGDTHLTTFGGLLYDFQASGDFVLAETGPDFHVQVRQVSGAPTWPNASVNKAVAMKVGKTRVAICLAPPRVEVDGKIASVADGQVLLLPDDADISRRGNAYLVRGPSGDSVRAELNNGWMNVNVGLGRWPSNVRGLLANANGNVNAIESRSGTVFTNPFSFNALYHEYGDSWRVPPHESLLSDCAKHTIRGTPRKPFYANDLDRKTRQRTRAVCMAAGVKEGPLLDACTLDVAVIGRKDAAKAFVNAPAPVAVAPRPN